MTLYEKFTKERNDLIKDTVNLYAYLASSYADDTIEMKRIYKLYIDFGQMKEHYIKLNNDLDKNKLRSNISQYQDKASFEKMIDNTITPLLEMLEFTLQLYHQNKLDI